MSVVDVNAAAEFLGLGDALNATLAASALSVLENATVGSVVGYVRATDADTTPLWGAKTWSLVVTPTAQDPTGARAV